MPTFPNIFQNCRFRNWFQWIIVTLFMGCLSNYSGDEITVTTHVAPYRAICRESSILAPKVFNICMNYDCDAYTFQFQVIIPGSWALALILNSPLFLFKDIEKKEDGLFCLSIWPERWMEKAYGVTWFLVVALPLSLMVGLYSRIVYALWFKRNEDNQLNHQKTVSVLYRSVWWVLIVLPNWFIAKCFEI